MSNEYLIIKNSSKLNGTVSLSGAKNAVLAIMSSLILTEGKSTLNNIPNSHDVQQMILLLKELGTKVSFDITKKQLKIDTSSINNFQVNPKIMNKMRASILVMGPLLARFSKAKVARPGGCLIGTRPINFHLNGFKKMGAIFEENGTFLNATLLPQAQVKQEQRIAFECPSVGATENIMMLAVLKTGTTTIVNAALEPEVIDVITVLQKMGAKIEYGPGLTLKIVGVSKLHPINHSIIPDRLEAGSLILAAAITKGEIYLPDAQPSCMDVFLEKLKSMGHHIDTSHGIKFKACTCPKSVSFKTGPYPSFPTDLQAPMMALQCLANGISEIEETIFENRLLHVQELKKMGAQIDVKNNKAIVHGIEELYGSEVIATDIRASCALALAGLAAQGQTKMTGLHHWKRGYDQLEKKLSTLGGKISFSPISS